MITRLAWRSIWRNRRRTLISVCSIAFGLALAVFFIALGEGMYAQMVEQVVRMQAGHVTLEHPDYRHAPAVDLWLDNPVAVRTAIERGPAVDRIKLMILGQGMARSAYGSVAVSLMGVQPSIEALSSPLVRHLAEGRYLEDQDGPLVVVGSELAEQLNLKVGRKIVLATNDAQGNLVEALYRVKGVFKTGSRELDANVIQIPLTHARQLFGMPPGSVTQMGVVLENADQQEAVIRQIRERLAGQPVVALPWQVILPELAAYIKMDRGSNLIFQGILIFLILFTIFNTILMSVLERQQEFAMLLALGTEPGQLRLQVFMESAFLGLIGCCLGLLVGGGAAYLTNIRGIDLSSFLEEGITISGFAFSTRLHTRLTAEIFLTSAVIVFVATLILSIIPMRHAVNLNLAEMLRSGLR